MKIIIETDNWEQDGKVRLGKIKKEIRNTMMRFGYNREKIDISVDVRGMEAGEAAIAYKHGYDNGFEAGRREGIFEKYTPNQIRDVLGLSKIKGEIND